MVCLVKCGLCGGNCTISIHRKSHPPKHIFNTHVKKKIILIMKSLDPGFFSLMCYILTSYNMFEMKMINKSAFI